MNAMRIASFVFGVFSLVVEISIHCIEIYFSFSSNKRFFNGFNMFTVLFTHPVNDFIVIINVCVCVGNALVYVCGC